ncbi:MAG: adenylate kinase [Candidatus Cloacimonetes bacterium 4572_55]|nr:MAG: adenylate kinase [Candidatus Cloacimonetes bacterium 4572_55]
MKRIVVLGTSGSGKTTLARDISEKLEIPHIEMDRIYWRPNWCPPPEKEFRASVQEAVQGESWVLDGNYSRMRDIIWIRATTLIWLDYSFPLVLWRSISRTVKRIYSGEELYAGNRETFRQSFLSRDSIILWTLKTYFRRKREYPILFEDPKFQHLDKIRFQKPIEAGRFVKNLPT